MPPHDPTKGRYLDEFIEVTGFHRKHAIRALRRTGVSGREPVPRSRVYDEAVRALRAALTVLWEAADRICGKRLKEAIPTLGMRWNDTAICYWRPKYSAVSLL